MTEEIIEINSTEIKDGVLTLDHPVSNLKLFCGYESVEFLTLPSKAEVEDAIRSFNYHERTSQGDLSKDEIRILLTSARILILLMKQNGTYEGWK